MLEKQKSNMAVIFRQTSLSVLSYQKLLVEKAVHWLISDMKLMTLFWLLDNDNLHVSMKMEEGEWYKNVV